MSYAIATAQRLGLPTFTSQKGSRFFASSRKGENFELKAELNSEYREKRRDAVKRVIANMTVGKDVSALFADVLKCMHTDDLPLKKLVYLYLMNHAKTQPELVILAVNTFVKDVDDPNPLIRALAIRTMGCLRSEKILDYLVDPLRKGLADSDAYVRKTAAICVAKIYDLNPKVAVENGFVNTLKELLTDPNPMVVANAITALADIKDQSGDQEVLTMNAAILKKMLTALNECTEWGQIVVLETLSSYEPTSTTEAEQIVEKVLPRLSHKNASVTLTAIRLLLVYLDKITDLDLKKQIVKKLSPPIVTMLSSFPELAYVVLRNIKVILNKDPTLLNLDLRVFFCQYTDPPYVKLEKMDLIALLCDEGCVDQVLSELTEYANDVDVEFSRKAIRVIGSIAVRNEASAERCVNTLLELVQTKSRGQSETTADALIKASHVIQEAVTVVKDIFRKYPNRFESVIPILCDHMDQLDETSSKAALVWVVGEYAERIHDTRDILEQVFEETFKGEHPRVQSAILTAAVKFYLKGQASPEDTFLVKRVLQTATRDVENPDIRDRAYIYLRLLHIDPNITKGIVLSHKPDFALNPKMPSGDLVRELIHNISSLASVYHKPCKSIVGNACYKLPPGGSGHGQDNENNFEDEDEPNLLDLDFGEGETPTDVGERQASPIPHRMREKPTGDLLGDDDDYANSSPVPSRSGSGGTDGGTSHSHSVTETLGSPPIAEKIVYLDQAHGKGLIIRGAIERRGGILSMELDFLNKSAFTLSEFAIQFNKNAFGLVPIDQLEISALKPGTGKASVSLPLSQHPQMFQFTPQAHALQVAVKTQSDVFYFQTVLNDIELFTQKAARKNRDWWQQEVSKLDSSALTRSLEGLSEVKALEKHLSLVSMTDNELLGALELLTPEPRIFLVECHSSATGVSGLDLLSDLTSGLQSPSASSPSSADWSAKIRCDARYEGYLEMVEGSIRNWCLE